MALNRVTNLITLVSTQRMYYLQVDSAQRIIYSVLNDGNQIVACNITSNTFAVFAGTVVSGTSGDGDDAKLANLQNPTSISIATVRNLVYIGTFGGLRVVNRTSNIISTVVAGNILAMSVDAVNNLLYYYVDNSYYIRSLNRTSGATQIVAGIGLQGETGNNGLATLARIREVRNLLYVPSLRALYLDQQSECYVRVVNLTSNVISVLTGSTSATCTHFGDGGSLLNATFSSIDGFAFDSTIPSLVIVSVPRIRVLSQCSLGKIWNGTHCMPCGIGTATAELGATTCSTCSAGSFALSGSLFCSTCLAGSFSKNQSAMCTLCSPGSYANTASAQSYNNSY